MEQKGRLPILQLCVLSFCRFSEPVALTLALPYLPQMIESFGIPQHEITGWVGIATSVIPGGQCLLGIPWGLLSDRVGRKPVLLSCLAFGMTFTLMTGLSRSLVALIVARAGLGLFSGNVGIARAMAAELVPQKAKRAEAFNVLYVSLSIAGILGPALGGALVEPAKKFPATFGKSPLLKDFPYLLPSLIVAGLYISGMLVGLLMMEETLESKCHRRDYGLVISRRLRHCVVGSRKKNFAYEAIEHQHNDYCVPVTEEHEDLELPSYSEQPDQDHQISNRAESSRSTIFRFYRTFSRRSRYILLTHVLVALHNMAFDALFPLLMHLPAESSGGDSGGGFGMESGTIGLLYLVTGVAGILFQFGAFPRATRRYGVVRCIRVVSSTAPILYIVTPLATYLPSNMYTVVVPILMFTKLVCTIFTFPCWNTLLNNSANDPATLGALNGAATSLTGIGRALGPLIIGSTAFGPGVKTVMLQWWILAAFGVVGAIPAYLNGVTGEV